MKKLFKKPPKDLTSEQRQELLDSSGVQTFKSSNKESKFGQFSNYAQQLASRNKPSYAPGQSSSDNPYARGNANNNPYVQGGPQSQNPYGRQQEGQQYGSDSQSGYSGRNGAAASNPYAQAERSYETRFGSSNNLRSGDNSPAKQELLKGARSVNTPSRAALAASAAAGTSQDELFDPPSQTSQNELFDPPDEFEVRGSTTYGQDQETKQMDSEDEDVEAIKGEIRFAKQETVNSSRNALRSAAEAEESGRNTLGMLGAQGERLANTERSLALAENQNRVAAEKAKELKVLNRSLFAPHISNPFTKERRLAEEEARIKQNYMRDQLGREKLRQAAWESQQRVINGLQVGQSETAMKYKMQSHAEERKKYQFEADSEDEEMENEIDSNIEALHAASMRLNKLAKSTNEEITRQNERLDAIADQTDRLDINVHLNTSRLANIK